jgi:hypothetical protein
MLTEVMAAALAAKLLASAQGALPRSIEPPARPQATVIYDPVTCVAVNKREVRSPFHVFACADVVFSGDVTGAVLTKQGNVRCHFDGFYDGACISIAGCGVFGTYC